jgi:hypothetical protein
VHDEDESCGSDGDTEDSGSGDDIDDSSNSGDDVSAAVIDRGHTEEDDCNEEYLAISDDEADLHGDAAALLSFASLVNTLPDPLNDDNEVISDPVTIESVVTAESFST